MQSDRKDYSLREFKVGESVSILLFKVLIQTEHLNTGDDLREQKQ